MDEPNILIKTALNDAVQKINQGQNPTEALKKVANEYDLNPNYIQRVGEALNVALHYKHFKTASDRSSEFEIADIPSAVESAFTFNEKTAAEYVSEQFPTNDANATVFNYNRMLSNPMYKRAFMEIASAPETHESYPTTFRTVYEKSANYIQKLQKQAEEAEVNKVAAEFDLNAKFSELVDEFKKDAGYRTSFEEFESQVYAKHGEASVDYLNLLHKTAAKTEERGVHDAGYMMFDQCKEAALFDSLMDASTRWIEGINKAAEVAENLAYESSYLKEAHVALGKAAAEKEISDLAKAKVKHEKSETAAEEKKEEHEKAESVEEEAEEEECEECEHEDPVLARVKKKVKSNEAEKEAGFTSDPVVDQILEKEAAGIGGKGSLSDMFLGSIIGGSARGLGGVFSGVAELVHRPATEAFTTSLKGVHKPSTPNLTLDNMERKLLLQELMLTDPILSKVNPAKVVRAFEQIVRLSPEISKEKEVVRAELRAMVSSQALSKYDADIMAKLDTTMLKRRVLTQAYNKGNIDQFRF